MRISELDAKEFKGATADTITIASGFAGESDKPTVFIVIGGQIFELDNPGDVDQMVSMLRAEQERAWPTGVETHS